LQKILTEWLRRRKEFVKNVKCVEKAFTMENGKWKMENDSQRRRNYPFSIIRFPL